MFLSMSESLTVNDPINVRCFDAPELDVFGNIRGVLDEQFLVEGNSEGELSVNIPTMIGAL